MPPSHGYVNLRQSLNSELAGLSAAQLEATLSRYSIDAESMEGWLSTLGSIGKAVLPAVGGIAGTFIGGPMGAVVGSKLGQLAGGALGGPTTSQPPARVSQTPATPMTRLSSFGGSPTAGRLMQTMLHPQTLQALMSMFLGPQLGRQNIPVGLTPVPASAFTNLLGVLANQAASEYESAASVENEAVPQYMQDYAGEAKGDPAVAEHRAEALYELLQVNAREYVDWDVAESAESEMVSVESEYDALDLADIAETQEA